MVDIANRETLELTVEGMDCAECATHVEDAVKTLPGIGSVRVLVAAERATIIYDSTMTGPEAMARAIVDAGYRVKTSAGPSCSTTGTHCATCDETHGEAPKTGRLSELIGWGLLALVAAVVVAGAIGERLGVFGSLGEEIPWPVSLAALLLGGWPVFRGVARAALQRRVTSHTLMTAGVLGALAIGEVGTAAVVVFFMRFADWLEGLTTARARQAIRQLVALAPQRARVVRDGRELEVPVGEVRLGEEVLVHPGERIPVDGQVIDGQAPVDQASITGESVPLDKEPGDQVFAVTIVQAGWLKIRVTRVGADTTFGRIVRLVEEAEAQKAPVQKFADRFSGYYLPVVLAVALLTLLLGRNVTAAIAVLVVACSCAIAIATPVAVLAAVGRAARRGILIKGGLVLEQLAKVDTVVLDKTGTITVGQPAVTDVVGLNGLPEAEVLRVAGVLERHSEHPLARAIVEEAERRGLLDGEPEAFTPLPGRGVAGRWRGYDWALGNRRLLAERGVLLSSVLEPRLATFEEQGKTAFVLAQDETPVACIALADIPRPEAGAAIEELRRMGISRLILLTGDNPRAAAAVATPLGLECRANLLPEDKIAAVRQLQAEGRVVLMVGDGVNDAPALAQADVGIAMGAAGADVAVEAADVALMRDDWRMVAEAIRIGRQTAATIRQNLGFTALYNLGGITLAAFGFLPPIWAAAAQSLPDVAILGNSARLLRRH